MLLFMSYRRHDKAIKEDAKITSFLLSFILAPVKLFFALISQFFCSRCAKKLMFDKCNQFWEKIKTRHKNICRLYSVIDYNLQFGLKAAQESLKRFSTEIFAQLKLIFLMRCAMNFLKVYRRFHRNKKILLNSRLSRKEVRRKRNYNLPSDLNFYSTTIYARNLRQVCFWASFTLEIWF